MLQLKSFDGIVSGAIQHALAMCPEITDYNVGSKIRTLIEAPAYELDQFYQQMLKGLIEAVPVAIFKGFSFSKLPASKSVGYVTFSRAPGVVGDVTIPNGSRVQVPGTTITFTVSKNTVLPSGDNTVNVFVSAAIAGTSGNAGTGTIIQLVDTIDGIASVSNASPMEGGEDEEIENDRKLRFQKWVNSLARATRSALAYGASTSALYDENGVAIEEVKKVKMWEPCIDEADPADRVPGYVQVYIWNGVDGASTPLLNQTQKILVGYTEDNGTKVPGWKGAGIIVSVHAIAAHVVNIAADLSLISGFTVSGLTPSITSAVDSYFAELEIGEPLVWTRLIEVLRSVDGVYDVSLTAPSGNVVPSGFAICTRGTIALT